MTIREKIDVAVALRWDGERAPQVTAKGRGDVAERITHLAREHGVPLEHDPELVEVLAQLTLGDHVPEMLFIAVAEIIAFAYMVRGELPEPVERALATRAERETRL
jgi:flagellar biosynthesis protein